MANVYIGLIHYPIYNKNYEVIATAITNLDIHDISRSAVTYAVSAYFIVHPLEQQRALAEDILGYWRGGFATQYNPDRNQALQNTLVVTDIEEILRRITAIEGYAPLTITTDAREYPNTISYARARSFIDEDSQPVLILFGTGNGIEKQAMQTCDYILEPIRGRGPYNHLCVRSAVAIILDRILGERS